MRVDLAGGYLEPFIHRLVEPFALASLPAGATIPLNVGTSNSATPGSFVVAGQAATAFARLSRS
jgi:hypothetical protein